MAKKNDSDDDFKKASETAGGNIGEGIKTGIERALSKGSIEGIAGADAIHLDLLEDDTTLGIEEE